MRCWTVQRGCAVTVRQIWCVHMNTLRFWLHGILFFRSAMCAISDRHVPHLDIPLATALLDHYAHVIIEEDMLLGFPVRVLENDCEKVDVLALAAISSPGIC